MKPQSLLALGAAYGFFGVLFGAFGAHALKARLSPEMLAVWKTGVEYQLVHALALLLVGLLALQQPMQGYSRAGSAFGLGVLLFSGSLYALALGGPRWLGPVTPLGGLALLSGWALLLHAAVKAA